MQEDVKSRFEDYEKRIIGLEKRIDDVKWYVAGFTGLFVVIFGLSSYLVNNNFNVEKKSIQDEQQELRNRERLEKPAQLELMGENGSPLDGQSIVSYFETDEKGGLLLVISLAMKNVGEASSGKLYVKVYTNNSVHLSDTATDEKTLYKYETVIPPEKLSPNEIPGG